MNPKHARLVVFHPEHDDYLRISTGDAKFCEIPVAVEDDLVNTALQVPRMPLPDTAVHVGLRVRHGRP